ncbi:Ribonucleotide reductase of class Ia (aerobic), alpha subunit [Kaumoebavirus]|uniref:ribonucleotide reductase n=1 Tax=Kaumoebavirus TaxID=1859492 RepID=UPI0009C3D953|nr:ribonucleotide reductase [Kaumoebavirus]ARA71906.1 Ribonucleotide reductase of class Ia (aerobic), alpha subunit [Kaumoebavirus]
MYVINRQGNQELLDRNQIARRLLSLLDIKKYDVDVATIAQKTKESLRPGISTSKIDETSALVCANLGHMEPQYSDFAALIVVDSLHKDIKKRFESMKIDYNFLSYTEYLHRTSPSLFKPEYVEMVRKHANTLEKMMDLSRDFIFSYGGFITFRQSYLLIDHNRFVCEIPQYLYMRVALARYGDNLEEVKNLYDVLSRHEATMATPVMYNSGLAKGRTRSCYLNYVGEDSVEEEMDELKRIALEIAGAGGVGVGVSKIRSNGSIIKSSNRTANGVIRYIKMLEDVSKRYNQAGKRDGKIAVYLEMWHDDLLDFLKLRTQEGDMSMKALDTFTALWVPDLFFKRLKDNGDWSLMSPSECPGLDDVWGDEFEALYEKYEKAGKARRSIPAIDIAQMIYKSIEQSGAPYMLSKDSANAHSHHAHMGTLKSSNLCVTGDTEIFIHRKGFTKIADVVNEEVVVWNGFEYIRAPVAQTGVDREIMRVHFSNDKYIDCTKNHEFFVSVNDNYNPALRYDANSGHISPINFDQPETAKAVLTNNRYTRKLQACELQAGMLISAYYHPGERRTMRTEIRVTQVDHHKGSAATYCINEPTCHVMMFNGVLSSQCAEILIYTDKFNTGVCSLSSLSLKAPLDRVRTPDTRITHDQIVANGYAFNFDHFEKVVRTMIRATDALLDDDDLPDAKSKTSTDNLRPIGIGEQGFADLLMALRVPFDSKEAVIINQTITNFMSWHGNDESRKMSIQKGRFPAFKNSPDSRGILQPFTWGKIKEEQADKYKDHRKAILLQCDHSEIDLSPVFKDWPEALASQWIQRWHDLAEAVKRDGKRNSLLFALMPTVNSSAIMNNSESFEPVKSNVFIRNTLSGDYFIITRPLVEDLTKLGLWNKRMFRKIKNARGMLRDIEEIPAHIKRIYSTAYEVPNKVTIKLSADRAPFICQTQSLNLYFTVPEFQKWISAIVYGWNSGLKTLQYYCHSQAKIEATDFSNENDDESISETSSVADEEYSGKVCTLADRLSGNCESCST